MYTRHQPRPLRAEALRAMSAARCGAANLSIKSNLSWFSSQYLGYLMMSTSRKLHVILLSIIIKFHIELISDPLNISRSDLSAWLHERVPSSAPYPVRPELSQTTPWKELNSRMCKPLRWTHYSIIFQWLPFRRCIYIYIRIKIYIYWKIWLIYGWIDGYTPRVNGQMDR